MQAVNADKKDVFDLKTGLAKFVIRVSWQSKKYAKAYARTQEIA
jgi:hypothetical protein